MAKAPKNKPEARPKKRRKPNKRTFEMLCFFFAGWATAEEVQRHLENLAKKEENSS